MMKGIIALDIDGTLTTDSNPVPVEVASYLNELANDQWEIALITGRSFRGTPSMLQHCKFNYYLALQNGAIILKMPEQKVVFRNYLDASIFPTMDKICHNSPSDFVIYGGFEHGDLCYYRPNKFSSSLINYLEQRIIGFGETWHPVETYDQLPIKQFPAIKCFGNYFEARELTRQIESNLGLHVPMIRDPFNENYYVVQAIHGSASKGAALKDIISLTDNRGTIIAAGDDYNDYSMWEVADKNIVMETAPEPLLKYAHLIATSAKKQGIIKALKMVTEK